MYENRLVLAYGGRLVSSIVSVEEAKELREEATRLPSIQITDRAACDLELIATGGFSPIDRFMGKDDFESVVESMRLADGTLFPIPVTLPVPQHVGAALGDRVALRDSHNNLLAVMDVEEAYEWDLESTAIGVAGTLDVRHPVVAEMHQWGRINLSGRLRVLELPPHHDFRELRMTPAQTRMALAKSLRQNVVAFQTRNPLHRVHEEMTKRAASEVDGVLLLHPVVGMTRPGDVDHYTRVRTYRALTERYYEKDRVLLSLLPLAMRMAGPREAVWHAIIRRNYGANHLIVGRDHAGPGLDSYGKPFYGPYDAQQLVERHADELGVKALSFTELAYVPSEDRYEETRKVPPGVETVSLSGTRVRQDYLDTGRRLPSWFTRPEVAEILGETYPPRHRQGVCIWFTGLSAAGKSATADVLSTLLMQHGRQVTVLDGDVVRTHLSKGLGFSKEDRDTNIVRIGFVASEVVRHGGIAICAAISPYRAARDSVRSMMGDDRFVEVFVDTPLSVCEQRDTKGMYARARAGEISGFTGIDDPYEAPLKPDITLDTVARTAETNAWMIMDYLAEEGFVRNLNRREEKPAVETPSAGMNKGLHH